MTDRTEKTEADVTETQTEVEQPMFADLLPQDQGEQVLHLLLTARP